MDERTRNQQARGGLVALIREDWHTHGRKWHVPGFHAIAVYRLGAWLASLRRGPTRALGSRLYGFLFIGVRNLYGIEIPRTARVGRRVLIAHQSGIVIGHKVEIGDESVIRQNVTIGAVKENGPEPRLGCGVTVGAGAVVAGGITIGDEAVIGPNAVVMADVPPRARVVAPPARSIGIERLERRSDVSSAAPGPTPPVDASVVAETVKKALGLETDVDPHTPLLSSGIVDSFNVVVLIDELEQRFSVAIPIDRIDAETFDTATQIAAVIAEADDQ
jgi:serine O-acetyltransferase